MELTLLHYQRVDTPDLYDADAIAGKIFKESVSRPYYMGFHLAINDNVPISDVIDACQTIEELGLVVVSRRQGGYQITVQSDDENWRNVHKTLKLKLEESIPEKEMEPPPVPETTPSCGDVDIIQFQPIGVEISPNLGPTTVDMVPSIDNTRRGIILTRGVVLPPVVVASNEKFADNQYRIMINETVVATGLAYPDKLLALDSDNQLTIGQLIIDQSTGDPARWITPEQVAECTIRNIQVVKPGHMIAVHVASVCLVNIANLFTREQAYQLVVKLGQTSPNLVNGVLNTGLCNMPELHKLLKMVLDQGGSIRNLEGILESVQDQKITEHHAAAIAASQPPKPPRKRTKRAEVKPEGEQLQ